MRAKSLLIKIAPAVRAVRALRYQRHRTELVPIFRYSERTQSFVDAGLATDCFPVTCSVPQLSVFGPLGFTAYTEDIFSCVCKTASTLTCKLMTHDSMTAALWPKPSLFETVCHDLLHLWCWQIVPSRRRQLNPDRHNFGSCLAHLKALGVCCVFRGKRDNFIVNNGRHAMWPFVNILWPLFITGCSLSAVY